MEGYAKASRRTYARTSRYAALLKPTRVPDAWGQPVKVSDLFAGLGRISPGLGSAILAQVHGWSPGWIIALALAVSFALPITSKTGNSIANLLDRVIETKGPRWFGLTPTPTQKPVPRSSKMAAPKH